MQTLLKHTINALEGTLRYSYFAPITPCNSYNSVGSWGCMATGEQVTGILLYSLVDLVSEFSAYPKDNQRLYLYNQLFHQEGPA
ncbi:MAG: hypothetical protein CTY12_06570 [Methylotenera sp.]|nr:MAG: hypothetical protein CTY12_06570 [Methylotenera sp.]